MANERKRRRTAEVTGVTIGPVGTQWEYRETDVKVVQDLVHFLEDRRVLFDPPHIEIVEISLQSIQEIRSFVTETLARTEPDSHLAWHLQLIRAACRDFKTRIETAAKRSGATYDSWGWSRFDTPDGMVALGQWRGLVLGNIAEIVGFYGVTVGGPLSGALLEPE